MDGTILYFFAAILLIGILLIVAISLSKQGKNVLDVDRYHSRWMTIEQELDKGNVSSYHLSILNADKLLDQALRERGIKGQTMGERMKTVRDTWTNRNDIWQAHKLRNQIAHESDVTVTYEQAKRALASFKQALKDVGAI